LKNSLQSHNMKTTITFLLASFLTIISFAQSFEGKIIYKNSLKSKIAGLTDEQFTAMVGATQEYYIKGGDYKSVNNGSLVQWQLYVNKDNKLYNKMSNSEALLFNEGAANTDTVLKAFINKGVTEILGYKCDELVLTCKSGVQKYYFSSSLAVDAKLYVNHKYGNWYEYLSRSNALPLKMVIDNAQFVLESSATEIKPMKLELSFFELPANVKTMKSPY
jgi:hypothetical protein